MSVGTDERAAVGPFSWSNLPRAYASGEILDWVGEALEMLNPALAAERAVAAFRGGVLEPGGAKARALVERLILSGRGVVQNVTGKLISDSIPPVRWFGGVMKDVAIRSTAASLALKGRKGLTKPEAGVLADRLTEQRGYLSGFFDQIKAGVQSLNEGALARASQYAESAWGTAWRVLTKAFEANGARLVKRVLGDADHCKQCIRLAAKGFIPLAELTPIGDTVCRIYCHCRLVFKPSWNPSKEELEAAVGR